MSTTVVSVTPFHWGHTSVVLSDGSTHIFTRGQKVPSVGSTWPPEAEDVEIHHGSESYAEMQKRVEGERSPKNVDGEPLGDLLSPEAKLTFDSMFPSASEPKIKTIEYPCGCSASGAEDLPEYCSEHDDRKSTQVKSTQVSEVSDVPMDPQASEEAPVEGQSAEPGTAGQNEIGIAPEPENGPCEEGQQVAKKKKA